jgi:cation/acetate symporter
MGRFRLPERDIGTARELIGSTLALIALFGLLIFAFVLLERLGMEGSRVPVAVVTAGALLVLVAAFLAPSRRPADFYVADRAIAPVRSGLAGAALLAGLVATGIGERAAATVAEALSLALGVLVGTALAAVAFAPALRRFGGYDAGDVLAARFGAWARAAVALVGFASTLLILVAALKAAGDVVTAAVGPLTIHPAAIAAGLAALAALPGGMRSVAAAQVTQYGLAAAACLAPGAILALRGGAPEAAAEIAAAIASQLLPKGTAGWAAAALPVAVAAAGMAAFPALLAQAHSVPSARAGAASLGWTALFLVALLAGVAVLGLGLVQAAGLITAIDMRLVGEAALGAALPPVVGGLILAGVLAALLAAAQSALFCAAAGLSHGIWDEIVDRRGPAGRRLLVARIAVLGVAAAGGWLAIRLPPYWPPLLPWALAFSAAAGFVPLFLGLWWRRCTATGFLLGTVAGCAIVGTAFAAAAGVGPTWARLAPAAAGWLGLVCAAFVAVVGSLATRTPGPEAQALVASLHTRGERPPMRERPA